MPFVLILGVIVLAAFSSIRIAYQYERAVIFRLGKFNRIGGPGLYFVIPIAEFQNKVDLRTVTANVEEQEGITRDNVPIKVDAVIWFRVVNPERAVMRVKDVSNAVVQVSLTTPSAVTPARSQMAAIVSAPPIKTRTAQ